MRKKSLSWALCGVFALALAAQAGVISVNFTEGHANQQLESTTSAGVWPRSNWNNTTNGANGTVNGLVDSAGVTNAGVSITWSTSNMWGDGWATTDANAGDGDAQLARGYLDDGGPVAIDVTGIPYANYNVVVFYSTDQGDPVGQFGSATFNGSDVYLPEGAGRRYDNDPQQWNTNTTVIATNLTLATLRIDMAARDGNSRSAVAGIQIVESTEGAHPPFPLPPDPQPPVWTENPITGADAYVDAPYGGTLADWADDSNDDPLTFAKVSGPDWLLVETNGVMSGSPGASDIGPNSFVVSVDDQISGSSNAVLNIEVTLADLGDSTAISVNFTEGHANQQMDPSNFAGLTGSVYTNWNNTTAETGSAADLADSDGNTTGCSISWNALWMWGDGVANTDATAGIGDAQLARGYLDDGNDPGTGAGFSLTDVPYDDYTLVLYLSTDTPGSTYKPFMVNGVTSAPTIGDKSQYKNPNWDETNTLVISNLTGDLTVQGFGRYEYLTGDERASLAGFQIVNNPYVVGDPATVTIREISGGTQMELSWFGQDGAFYGVETNSDLIIANWGTLETGIPGLDATLYVTNDVGPDETFYRVISE